MRNKLQNIAKILRKRPTEAEKFMWRYLRSRQLRGLKFRRQEPIGNYVVDFVCYEKKIIVEIDGGQHCAERDGNRDRWLESQDFKILRFWNTEVLKNAQGVWEVIRKNCLSCDSPSPAPPIKGGEIYEHDHRKA
ncbi:MAG TPA: endonuclease domain-containing protein [Candidatus Wunengus sp. YC63]|uniref:endonuclease domain-containing protein n=1 Tax=unclassified Candidatus Wunengus TaxID=3367695 RepID=UPI004027DEDE